MKRTYDEALSPEAQLLDQYLYQYRKCLNRKRELEVRRKDIEWEFNHPLKGVSYDGMPHGSGESVGCAALSFRLDEIDTRIKEQMAQAAKVLTEIMDVIDFLPENTTERSIIEQRYIDRKNWIQICRANHISKTPAIRYWKKGLYKLLEFKKIQMLMEEYENSMEDTI